MADAQTSALQDETAMRWSFLDREADACIVVSERMEFVYMNAAALALVPGDWFGKRCFEVLPLVDQTCAFHCDKLQAVRDTADVVYCEETVGAPAGAHQVLGVGLVPVEPAAGDPARAVLLLREKAVPVLRTRKDLADEFAFESQIVDAGRQLQGRISREHPPTHAPR